MKRLTELTAFTLAVLTLTTLGLYGMSKFTISLSALADNVSKSYLKREKQDSFPEIEFSNKTTEEIEMEGR